MPARIPSVMGFLWNPLALCLLLAGGWLVIDATNGPVFELAFQLALIYLVMVLALQTFSGNSGVLSFGHVGFVAVGAYVSALLTIPPGVKDATFEHMPSFLSWVLDVELAPLPATLAGGAAALVLAVLFTPAIVRLNGVQGGIATLALLLIVFTFNTQTTSITGGATTMVGVPPTTSMTTAFMWACVAIVVAYLFRESRRGLRLRATRENEPAARSVSVSPERERAIAWLLSAFMAGVAGALYAHFQVAFSATSFYFDITFVIVAMLVVGGMGSVSGAVLGCFFVSTIQEALRRFEVSGLAGVNAPTGTAQLGLALVLLVALVLRPDGLTGGRELTWPPSRRRWRRRDDPVSVA